MIECLYIRIVFTYSAVLCLTDVRNLSTEVRDELSRPLFGNTS